MELYYIITFFIIGTLFGSFFNVAGYRLPKEESILFPPSHCPKCNYRLKAFDLIPIVSYFILKAKCRNCKTKISWFYPLFEFITGVLFALSYYVFGMNLYLLIVLIFVSSMIIIFISDYQTMIIPDEVIIFSSISILILTYFNNDLNTAIDSLMNGIIAFVFMFSLKSFGDFIFKKESMGGGDIKLLFVFGLLLGWEMSIISIFIASLIGLPISIIYLKIKKENIIPFGPFLTIAALIILFLKIDITWVINILV
jgi:leader peptidase (prepilin peptidase) / N-methyltransferase